jgi:hypothetical protein
MIWIGAAATVPGSGASAGAGAFAGCELSENVRASVLNGITVLPPF